eukprot:UN00873
MLSDLFFCFSLASFSLVLTLFFLFCFVFFFHTSPLLFLKKSSIQFLGLFLVVATI